MDNIKKVLWVGDVHIDDRTPSSRKDNYLTAILAKLEEITKIAINKNVDIVI